MTRGVLAVLLALASCGDEAPRPRKPVKNTLDPEGGGGGGAPASASALGGAGVAGQKPVPLNLYPKVDDKYRKEFSKDDFVPDPDGDRNRDPFRAYFIDPTPTAASVATTQELREDYCAKRMVAENYGFRDLQLIGVLTGKKRGALFLDGQKYGHIAHLGDCLSKDKARVIKIEGSTVEVEIRGEAPPGGAAPAPHREIIRLHPEEIEAGEIGEGVR